MSCPCCAHIRLISAISADLCYTHFPALFSFCFVIIFPARIGALYSIQRSGNDRSKPEECEGLQELRAQGGSNAGMFCRLT